MPTRRTCVRWAVAVPGSALFAGCSSRQARSDSSPSTPDGVSSSAPRPGASERLQTPLGVITLSAEADRIPQWRREVADAADVVARVWGRGHDVTVTICDDAEFAGLTDGLDAGTAAVTTRAGVFLGPALLRSETALGRTVVIAHELTHARLGQAGVREARWWLAEGVAEWTAAGAAPGLTPSERWPELRQATSQHRVYDGPPRRDGVMGSALGYEWAHAYVTYLADVAGTTAVKELVRRNPRDPATDAASLSAHAQPFGQWLAARWT